MSSQICAQSSAEKVSQLIANDQLIEAITEADIYIESSASRSEKGRIIQLQADAYYYLNDLETSLAHYLLAAEQFEKDNNKSSLHYMECISHAGFCYRELGKLDKVLVFYKKALTLAQALQDTVEIASQYSNLGTTYSKIGDLNHSLEYLQKAYEIDLILKDTAGLGFDLRSMGDIHMVSNNHTEAIRNYRESLELLKMSSGNRNSYARRVGSLGNAYLAAKQYDSAEYYLQTSLQAHEVMGDTLGMGLKWVSLARLNLAINKPDEATQWAKRAKDYFARKGDNNHLIAANEVLIDIGLSRNAIGNVESYIDENIAIAQQQQLLTDQRNAYRQKAKVYELKAQYEKAYQYYQRYKQLDDSVVNQAANQSLNEMQVRYEVDRVEQQNEILQLENDIAASKLQWLMIASGLSLVLIVAVSLGLYARNQLKSKLLQEEVDGLRSQIQLVLEGDTSSQEMDLMSFNNKLEAPLSEREFEILKYAVSDMSNGQIAEEVSSSVNTVKYHLKNIYKKMGVSSRKEALQFAINTIK